MNTPHKYRRSAIHFWLLAPIAVIIVVLLFSDCSPRNGCKALRGMSGYGYLRNLESGRVSVLSPSGKICYYWEKPMSHKEAQEYLNSKY